MRDPNQIQEVNPLTGRLRVRTVNNEKSMAQDQFREESDINNIMAKYQTTGEWQGLTSKGGVYADVSNITDYQDMVHQVQYAQQAFASLPAKIRSRFGNDPGNLLEFIQDDKNYDEAVKLGLIEAKEINPSTPTTTTPQKTQTPKPKTPPKTDPPSEES